MLVALQMQTLVHFAAFKYTYEKAASFCVHRNEAAKDTSFHPVATSMQKGT